MALMNFREPNQVKWVGVKPAHNGTQVAKSITGVNAAATILYTVSTGKTLYLCSAFLNTRGTAGGIGALLVRDTSDVLQYYILYLRHNGAIDYKESITFWPPMEIPEGYDVCIMSNVSTEYTDGSIFGWEE